MSYVTVSARIRRELYLKIQKYGIKVSEVIRKALEEEVRKREEEEAKRMLDKARRILSKIPAEEIVEAVREAREER